LSAINQRSDSKSGVLALFFEQAALERAESGLNKVFYPENFLLLAELK